MADSNYGLFKIQIIEEVDRLTQIASNIKDNKNLNLQIMNFQQQANGYCMLIKEAIKTDNQLNYQLALPWKSASRCTKFISDKAFTYYTKGSNSPVMLDSNTLLSWIKEYYSLDDKEQIEEEERKAEEERIKKEEAAKKKEEAAKRKAERLEKDLKRATNLLEKMYVLSHKPTEPEKKFLEKLRKEGALSYAGGKYQIRKTDDVSEDSDEELDEELDEEYDDDELEFMSLEEAS